VAFFPTFETVVAPRRFGGAILDHVTLFFAIPADVAAVSGRSGGGLVIPFVSHFADKWLVREKNKDSTRFWS